MSNKNNQKENNKKRVGNKFDGNKPPVTQFLRQFPRALKYLSLISQHGHQKYGQEEDNKNWDNWKHVEDKQFRYEQAMGRHMLERSDDLDKDSGFYSIGHCAWDALAVLETILMEQENLEKGE